MDAVLTPNNKCENDANIRTKIVVKSRGIVYAYDKITAANIEKI